MTIHPGGPLFVMWPPSAAIPSIAFAHGRVRGQRVTPAREEFAEQVQLLAIEVRASRGRRRRAAEMPQDEQLPRHRDKQGEGAHEAVEGRELTLLEGTARLQRLEVLLDDPPRAIVIDHGGRIGLRADRLSR